jgi:hypothetical protein
MDTAIAERLIESQRAESGRTRDQELVRYVGRHGVVTIGQVMKAMEMGRTVAYRRVAACAEAGLLERLDVLSTEPSILRATRDGLRYAGLGLPVAEVSPGAVVHWLRCAATAQHVGEHFGHDRVLTERELMAAEACEPLPIASAAMGDLRKGPSRWHRPDLAVITEDEGTIAVEVELTPKAPSRLQGIIRAWRRASWVSEVHYFCGTAPTQRAVERAVKATGASKILIVDWVPR